MYQLTPSDLEVQARARALHRRGDSLRGRSGAERRRAGARDQGDAPRGARELGLLATNMPVELGGGGYTMSNRCWSKNKSAADERARVDGDHATAVVPARRQRAPAPTVVDPERAG